jgi:hypothetical protein
MSVFTENDAKKQWCPFTRLSVGYGHPASINRFVGGGEMTDSRITDSLNCVGSKCMAWRWVDPAMPGQSGHSVNEGYCGLAGKP